MVGRQELEVSVIAEEVPNQQYYIPRKADTLQ